MGEDLGTSPGATIEALVRDINGTDGSHPNTIEGRKHKSGSETVDLLVAIDNFKTGARGENTGEAGSAKGEDSVRGKLAIVKISLYDGNNNMPTVKDYTAYADVTGVNNLVEVSLKIAAATQADSDTRSEIQTLVNDAPGLAAAKKSTLEAMVFGWLPSVPFISLTSAAIVSPGDLVLKSLPICEIALKIRPNRPALSFCAGLLLRSVGNVVITSILSRPKAVATLSFFSSITLAKSDKLPVALSAI
jgi:hypothetical protein